ncbi:FAD-binding oxidoreductase [Lutibacter sp.]|uniref:NAD(P)/FAD-dependent oxidoreductase n=1 Tax=Lutibacter sp. TaxID=1925666 RepID=UPI0027337639|nr:FAD-binding oxidoreductase [Lutibacter sp.]MDP3311857.1 FAD-binding oxidoreductase [Lutibacter sp.]
MKVDYIIVGLGLAGIAVSNELERHNRSFIVFENHSQNSSIVAGGMYNPVILKRFTPVWDAEDQLKIALTFYQNLEQKLKQTYHKPLDIYRIFKSIEEQNNWFAASDHKDLSKYFVTTVVKNENEGIMAPYGFGKLVHTGKIDTKNLISDYSNYLKNKDLIKCNSFNYNQIQIKPKGIVYENITASKIIFCEGFGIKSNPFFNYLPLQEAKGELITMYAPKLKIDFLIKAAVFVMPLGDDLYKVGATFNWVDKTNKPTDDGKKELVEKLNSFIKVPYTIVDHSAGIRPTVKDRRPLVGVHPIYKNMAILNGLGTRGVMIAPKMAKKLYQLIENEIQLENEISINRFDSYLKEG